MARSHSSLDSMTSLLPWLAAAGAGYGIYQLLRSRGLVGRATLDAADMLRSDHEKVKRLFRRYAETKDPSMKDQLANDLLKDLEIHETIENEIFYPAVRRATGRDDIMDLAEAEHQAANETIAAIQTRMATRQTYDDLMETLATQVREHIAEEEGDMLPRAEQTDLSMQMLGVRMLARKQQLKMRLGFNTAALKQDLSGKAPSAAAEPVA